MPENITVAIIGSIQAVATAIVGGLFLLESRRRKKQDAQTEARSKIRAEESRLSMQLMSANTSLNVATANAIKEGKTNGKMASALEAAEKAQKEYFAFINRIASTQMIGE